MTARHTTRLEEVLAARAAYQEGADPRPWFDAVADAAIRRCALAVGPPDAQRLLAIEEVEFYLYSDEHPDRAVHRHPAQYTFGRWYFHRESAAAIGYTLKGLDLTFGGPGVAGGMLIRALSGVPDAWRGAGATSDLVEGPSRVVDVLLRACDETKVLDLRKREPVVEAFAEAGLLRIADRRAPTRDEVHVGRRVGLGGAADNVWTSAAYRYRAHASRTSKDRRALLAGRKLPVRAVWGPHLTDAELCELLGW